tara:strand:+ start:1007 stop:1351 length:345 start_codon:yes stop_codon:yes gene_type:complete
MTVDGDPDILRIENEIASAPVWVAYYFADSTETLLGDSLGRPLSRATQRDNPQHILTKAEIASAARRLAWSQEKMLQTTGTKAGKPMFEFAQRKNVSEDGSYTGKTEYLIRRLT